MCKDHYETIHSRDNPEGASHGRIQWKGTDVCIDLHCECGNDDHFDGDFLYYYECSACGKKYAMGMNVALIPLTPAEISYVGDRFKRPDPDID